MAKYLLDEFGEVLGEFEDNSRIVVYNELNTKRKSIENKMFYKLYKDGLLVFIHGKIGRAEEKTFFNLIRLLEFNINEFVCFNGLPANLSQLSSYLNLKRRTLHNHLKKLEQLEIIKKVKRGRNVNVMINPYFISYGSNNTDEALKIFGNSVWAKSSLYSKKKRRIKENGKR